MISSTTYTAIAGAAVSPGDSIPQTLINPLISLSSITKSPVLLVALPPANDLTILWKGISLISFWEFFLIYSRPAAVVLETSLKSTNSLVGPNSVLPWNCGVIITPFPFSDGAGFYGAEWLVNRDSSKRLELTTDENFTFKYDEE